MIKPQERQTALVTGASGGIGACIAEECVRRGLNVGAVGRNDERLQGVASRVRLLGADVRVVAVLTDLLAAGALQQLVDAVAAERLQIDLLVNCAGFGRLALFAELPLARQLEVHRINFEVPVALTSALLPTLIQRRGAVLNISSLLAYLLAPNMSALGASKAAMLSWSVALRRELMGTVAVTAFCPGVTRTRFMQTAGMSHLGLERTRSQQSRVSSPGGRWTPLRATRLWPSLRSSIGWRPLL